MEKEQRDLVKEILEKLKVDHPEDSEIVDSGLEDLKSEEEIEKMDTDTELMDERIKMRRKLLRDKL